MIKPGRCFFSAAATQFYQQNVSVAVRANLAFTFVIDSEKKFPLKEGWDSADELRHINTITQPYTITQGEQAKGAGSIRAAFQILALPKLS